MLYLLFNNEKKLGAVCQVLWKELVFHAYNDIQKKKHSGLFYHR